MEYIEHKGVTYEKIYGKLIRALDREQAQINENQRVAFFKRREKELGASFEKMIEKKVARLTDESDRRRERKALEEEYYGDMEERIIREWKKLGKTDRDWTKVKVVLFDEQGKPMTMKVDEYRNMLK